jgi:hypothetical protein
VVEIGANRHERRLRARRREWERNIRESGLGPQAGAQMARSLDENSNLLFETLADRNHQLEHSDIDFALLADASSGKEGRKSPPGRNSKSSAPARRAEAPPRNGRPAWAATAMRRRR